MNERRVARINLPARAAAAEQRRLKTRERLLAAAEAVIADKGFRGASIEDFVAAAGVSRGTFYNYFPTTTALLHAMNTRVAGELDAHLDSMVREIEDPVTRLASTFHAILAAYLSDPVRGWVAMRVADSAAPRQGAFEDRFARNYREAVALGRFREIDMTAAWTVAFGAMRMAQRDAVTGAAAPVQTVQVVALVLSAFGVPYDEAHQISAAEAEAARVAMSAART